MSKKNADMSLAKNGDTETSPPAGRAGSGSGSGEKKETKTVQTVDYRESAGGQEHVTRPVEIVHEIPSKENDPIAAPKQD